MTFLPSHLHPSQLAHPAPSLTRSIVLGAAGSDPENPCLVLLCFDDSGSLTSGNDPVGARYDEAKRAVNHIAAASSTDTQRLAIFRFDHPIVRPVGPRPLRSKRHQAKLVSAIDPPTGITGSSSLTPAMMAMNRLAERHPEADRIAVIFSDFELCDHNQAQPYAEISSFPGLVHAVVMNASPPPELNELPNVLVTRVSSADPPGRLAAALTHSLAAYRPGAGRPSYTATPHKGTRNAS